METETFLFYWNALKNWMELANRHGFPVPLIILVIILFVLERGRARWLAREKHYYDLLSNLGLWENTLVDRLDYYQEPGSEYKEEHTETEHFTALAKKGSLAFDAVRESMNLARLFLSKKSIAILEELMSEHQYIKEHGAACKKEYLDLTYKIVKNANDSILKDAQRDLKRSQLSAITQNIKGNIKI